jgi:hypothetical protein
MLKNLLRIIAIMLGRLQMSVDECILGIQNGGREGIYTQGSMANSSKAYWRLFRSRT